MLIEHTLCKKIHKFNKQEGQTLVIILILMIISLGIGIAVSSKFITSTRTITEKDNSTRALNVAESAIEHMLVIPIETLEDYALNGTCGSDCQLQVINADGQVATANIEITMLGDSNEPFLVELKEDETAQVNLTTYPDDDAVTICWNDDEMSVAGMYIYGQRGNYQSEAFAYNPVGSTHIENNFDLTNPLLGYNSCFDVTTKIDSVMLRLKAYYNEANVMIIPSGGASIPTQGILLESIGTAGDAVRKVSVIVTDPILPAQFDYAIYQRSASEPLSN